MKHQLEYEDLCPEDREVVDKHRRFLKSQEIERLRAELKEKQQHILELEMRIETLSSLVAASSDLLEHHKQAEEQIIGMRENKLYLENDLALKTERIAALKAEAAKHKAFWDQSRLADKQSFEAYDWKNHEHRRL